MPLKKIISAITAGIITASMLTTYISADDININYHISCLKNIKSYIAMQDTSIPSTRNNGDLNSDGEINAFDAVISKQDVMDYDKSSAPIDELYYTMPNSGDVNSLLFSIEFQDIKYTDDDYPVHTTPEIQDAVFSPENPQSANYPFESVTAFYKRASLGKLNIDGTVYSYTAKENRADYEDDYEKLIMEILDNFDSQIDFSKYDQNNDGYIDSLVISVPTNGDKTADEKWWGNTSSWYKNYSYSVDGMKIQNYIINDAQPTNMVYYNEVICHEMGHAMGLPDYYYYSGFQSEGFMGEAGYELMDDMCADLSQFSKIMLGWITSDNIKIADNILTNPNDQTFELSPCDTTPDTLIIPIPTNKDKFNYFSEYFIVEYQKGGEGSNNKRRIYNGGGIRVFHVDASLIPISQKMMLKNENFADGYVDTHRVLQLVGDTGYISKYYVTGDTISSGTNHFAWYDNNNNETVDTGFSIKIGDITADGKYTVTITK